MVSMFCFSAGTAGPTRRVPAMLPTRDASHPAHAGLRAAKLPVGVGQNCAPVRMN